jgi:type IV pilus assembly protein PilP
MIACLVGIFLLFMGCGDKAESPKPKQFTQKITRGKTPPQDRKPPLPQLSEAKADAVSPEVKVPEAKPLSVAAKPVTDDSAAADMGAGKMVSPTPETVTDTTPTSAPVYSYNPKGKMDPFMAWHEDRLSVSKDRAKERRPLSPLQRVDLSQLKLVGIILSDSGNQALVEEVTGKGFIIEKGTYIGLNRGKVSRILPDRIIIEESIQYGMGDSSVRKRELKLQKQPGDD